MEDINFPYLRKRNSEDFGKDIMNSYIDVTRPSVNIKNKLLSPPDIQETYMPETMRDSLYFDYKKPIDTLQGLDASKSTIIDKVIINRTYQEGLNLVNTIENTKFVKTLFKSENLESTADEINSCKIKILKEVNFAGFFKRNRLILESFTLNDKIELFKEFDSDIDDICIASRDDDGFNLAIKMNQTLNFVYVSYGKEIFVHKWHISVDKNVFLCYHELLNSIIIVENSGKFSQIEIDTYSNIAKKIEIYSEKESTLSLKRLKRVSAYIPFIKNIKQPKFKIKKYDMLLISHKFNIEYNKNTFKFFTLDPASGLLFYAYVNLKDVLELNKLIIGEYYDNVTNHDNLVDFRYDVKNDKLFLLFKSGIELQINIKNNYVDKLIDYNFDIKGSTVQEMLGYTQDSYIYFKSNDEYYLIPTFESRKLFMSCSDEEFAILLPLTKGILHIEMLNVYDIIHGNNPVICYANNNNIKFYELLHPTSQLYNILYLETFYNEYLVEEFYEEVYHTFFEIGKEQTARLLHEILLLNKNSENLFNNEYNIYLKSKFIHNSEKIPFISEKGNELYRIQRSALKFIYAFSRLNRTAEVPKPRTLLDSEIIEIEGVYEEKEWPEIKNEEPDDSLLILFYKEIGLIFEQLPFLYNYKNGVEKIKPNILISLNIISIVDKSSLFTEQLFYLLEILMKDKEILNEAYKLQKHINFILGGKALLYIDPEQEKLLIKSATANIIRRSCYFFNFLSSTITAFDLIKDEYKRVFATKPMKAFVIDKENDVFIKYILIDYSYLSQFKNKDFTDYYIKPHEKNALTLLNDIRSISEHLDDNKKIRGSEHIDSDYLVEVCKKLEYRYISNYSNYFWKLGRFVEYLKLCISRLELNLNVIANYSDNRNKEIIKREMENENIYFFLISFLVAVVNTHNFNKAKKEKSVYIRNISTIFSEIKNLITAKDKVINQRLDVEQALKSLSNENLDELMKHYILLVLSSNSTKLRTATLKIMVDNIDKRAFQYLALSKSISELEILFECDELFKGSITIQNADFVIQLALSQKNYALALNIIVELSYKNRSLPFFKELEGQNIFDTFTNNTNSINIMTKKIKKERVLSLNLLESYVIKAQNFSKNLDPYDYETAELYNIIQKIAYNVKVNKIILKELNAKLEYLKSLSKLCHIELNFDDYNRLLEYVEMLIEYVESCPDYTKEDLIERIVIPNRLHYVVLKLRSIKEAKAEKYIGDLINCIKAKARIRNLMTLADMNSHIKIDTFHKKFHNKDIKDLFKVKSPELAQKTTMMAFDMKLLYPENIPKCFHYYIEKVFVDKDEACKMELVEIIEISNMQNKAFKDLGNDFTKVNFDRYFELSLWHIYPIVKPNNSQSMRLFELLIVYQKLIDRNLNVNSQADKLVYRLLDSFLILLNYGVNQIFSIIQSITNSQAETMLVIEFLENNDRITEFLRFIKKSIEMVNGTNFYMYFSFNDRIDKLLLRMKSVRNNSKIQHYIAIKSRNLNQ